MIRVSIIGSGNVAEALAIAVAGCDSARVVLREVVARNPKRREAIGQLAGCDTAPLESVGEADIYILAVYDGVIERLRSEMKFPAGALVVHSAGSVPMGSCDGVIYPMQTFTVGRRVDFREVPLFIEGRNAECLARIKELSTELSRSVKELNSDARRELHLAAVFACNFTNAMLSATDDILSRCGVELELYHPLVMETISKAFSPARTPRTSQTGPARRGDYTTMAKHDEMLQGGDENLREIYKTISKYIWETSKKI